MDEDTRLDHIKIPGLGPRSLEKLIAADVNTVGRLLECLPREYLDYSSLTRISDAPLEIPVRVAGRILSVKQRKIPRRNLKIFELLLDDDYGTLRIIWYNQPWLADKLVKGARGVFSGKIRFDKLGRVMSNPVFELTDQPPAGGIEAVYRQIGGLKSSQLAAWTQHLLERLPDLETLPDVLLQRFEFPSRKRAFQILHQPPDAARAKAVSAREDPAIKRLIFEEFYHFQVRLQGLSTGRNRRDHVSPSVDLDALDSLISGLPFSLTGDQKGVLDALIEQLNAGERLHAMIQGDVGCGKTLIGLITAFLFFKAGYQTLFLCPTGVLAGQHLRTARDLLGPTGMRIELVTADSPRCSDQADLVVGTHRLFNPDVKLRRLALVLIDEQHRFGVEQRAAVLRKAKAPHYLAFTATPIPRSLALTLHGDFTVLPIRQRPPGRRLVKTILKKSSNRGEIIDFALARIQKGESVFWVFPMIDRSEDETASAQAMYQSFRKGPFGNVSVGLVHGRMERAEIEAQMAAFKAGEIKLLVATTVIEVGVDVPRASVMVVEGAERFGLSQLHQLRGRIGRGGNDAWCFFVLDAGVDGDVLERMRFLEKNHDGFDIAEYDLNRRGAGTLLGKRQSGKADFRMGDPWRDRNLMETAAEVVREERNKKAAG